MFVHLHVHSHYSLLDALPKIDELVDAAKAQHMSALALTDYGSMYGAIEFYQRANAAGIKPIIGFEAYIASGSLFSKGTRADKKASHLVLLAKNYEGYKNLMELSSIGHLEGFYYVPRIDTEVLAKHAAGIVALSGCMAGEIPRLVHAGETEKAKKVAKEYEEIFGKGNWYIELQDHPALEGQVAVNTQLISLARELDMPLVVTRDVHYMHTDDAEAQDILTCIKKGQHVGNPGRFTLRQVDRSFGDAKDIASRFRHVPDAIENTVKIAEQCTLNLTLNTWHFPPVEVPSGTTLDEVLQERVYTGIKRLVPEVTDEIQERLAYELSIICTKGYAPYFIAVAEFIQWSRDQGIVVTTRGSAAGSLVSYALGIVTVNPLYFKLPFERFLNKERPLPPDIDMDYADDRRDEVIEYVTNKYGKDKVAQIITFGTMAARGSVRDAGRALGFSYTFCDQVAKLIPFGAQGFPMTIKRALEEAPDLKKLYKENDEVQRLLAVAQKIEGCARHCSIHAAGVVIAPTKLTDFTPIQREAGGEKITTQYEMKSVEAAGLLKMDFLGIRNLSILGNAIKIIERLHGKKIILSEIPFEDAKTFAMLTRGETMGVFQLSGSGMTRYLKELRPTTIHDIMAMVALFRPGPMDSIPEYIARKHGRVPVEYLDPRLEKILDRSFGVLVYQDDVMLIAITLAGYSWLDADKLRKAMGKKIPEEMAKQKDKFFKGCLEFGKISKLKAERLWQLIEPFAAYGFNKAHAASYAVVAYQTAYLKANYPVEFMTAVLTAESGDMDKVAEIVKECRRMGILVLPPDINESLTGFAMKPDAETPTIRFGLTAVKNVGEHIVQAIREEIKKNGQFISLEDFFSRVQDKDLNKKSLESLIKCGALDIWGERGRLLNNTERMLRFVKEVRSEKQTNQSSLFGSGSGISSRLMLEEGIPASSEEKLTWEKELIGLYISSHPFVRIASQVGSLLHPIEFLTEAQPNTWVTIGGVVTGLKRKITKKGSVMLFVTIEDTTGGVEVLVFPKVYEQTQEMWQEGILVCVQGKMSETPGETKIFCEKAMPITEDTAMHVALHLSGQMAGTLSRYVERPVPLQYVRIILDAGISAEQKLALKNILEQYPGDYPVLFVVRTDGREKKIQSTVKVKPVEELVRAVSEIVGEGTIEVKE